jgi:hypothetical protein
MLQNTTCMRAHACGTFAALAEPCDEMHSLHFITGRADLDAGVQSVRSECAWMRASANALCTPLTEAQAAKGCFSARTPNTQVLGHVQVSLAEWNQDERFGAFGGPHAMVMGGYGQLAVAIADLLPDVRYNAPVSSITYSAEGATVATSSGLQLDVDAVIVSVPVGVLQQGSISFSPPLPPWKMDAYSRIGMGKLNKVLTLHELHASGRADAQHLLQEQCPCHTRASLARDAWHLQWERSPRRAAELGRGSR